MSCKHKIIYKIDSSIFESKKYKNLSNNEKSNFLNSIDYTKQKKDTVLINFVLNLSSEYFYLNDYKKSVKLSKEALKMYSKIKDSTNIAKSNMYIGDYYSNINKYDSSYFYYQNAQKIYSKLKNKQMLGKAYFKKAYILFYEGNYTESEIQASKSLILLKETKNYQLLFSAYSILGADFEKLEEYDNALKYYLSAKEVLRILQKNEKDFDSQFNYNLSTAINLSNTYQKIGNYKKAIDELTPLINDEAQEKWPKEYAIVLSNVGNARMQIGDLKQANALFIKALEISKKNNFEDNIVYEYINLGEYYYKISDFIKSKYYLKEALKLAQKIKATDEVKTALRLLVKVDTSNHYFYDEKYIAISDSLVKAQRNSRNKYARIEYETSVVEDENKVLSTKNTYIIISSLLLIFALVLIIVYRDIKSQKRELLFRITQQKAEEEIFELLKEYQIKLVDAKEREQNRISKELHDSVMNDLYGARMQLGILNDSDVKEIKEKRLIYVDLLQEIEQEIRTISHDLQSDVIDNQFDYVSLLSNLIQLQNEIGVTLFSFEVDPNIDWDAIDSLVKITIFRIVQESLLNVTKHAKAKECTVYVSLEANHLILLIKDDGIGFDVNTTKQGIGLNNIQERANTIKSALEISSTYNKGTSIRLNVRIGSL